MEPNSLKWVGSSCGLHGPYIFYKAFQFLRDGKSRILSLGDFFFVRCKPEDPVCIAELQLLWEERTSKQLLSSSKLYFLPEDTPQGRTVTHGEHEVIAVSEKVIVRLADLVKWSVQDWSSWSQGLKAEPLKPSVVRELGTNGRREALHRYRESTLTSGLNFKDVQRERAQLGQDEDEQKILVLSYPQYCRYRSVSARLAEPSSSLLINHTVLALGGIAALDGHIQILYCRDTFDHPTLLENESICDHFAPNLKGRPRKKKLSFRQRRDSHSKTQSQGSSSRSVHGSSAVSTQELCSKEGRNTPKLKHGCRTFTNGKMSTAAKHKSNGLSKKICAEEKEEEQEEEQSDSEEKEKKTEETSEESRAEEQAFLVSLYKYMKNRDTPIERIPFLGFKQINLWTMFQAAQKLGGYELITVRRQWKHVYDELGGNPSSTSAATCTRRHYERLLLPYERNLKGEQDKPLPLVKPRKPESSQEKSPVVRSKGVSSKKVKVHNSSRPGSKKDKVEVKVKSEDQTQNSRETEEDVPTQGSSQVDQPIIIEEEELHLTLKKEESLTPEQAPSFCPAEPDCRAPAPALPLGAGAGSEWRQISKALQVKLTQSEGNFIPKNSYLLHRWDQNRPAGHVVLPETYVQVQEPRESYGGRVGKVLPMCKQADRPCVDLSSDSEDYGATLKESPPAPAPVVAAAYCKSSQGVMSPLAKKKLLSQVCESKPFSFTAPAAATVVAAACLSVKSGTQTENENQKSEEDVEPKLECVSDGVQEVAAIFRPSVIQHAQSSKPQAQTTAGVGGGLSESYSCRTSLHLQPTWQPYLCRGQAQDGVESCGEKLLQVPAAAQPRGYTADCYSSPHLHSLYRQTENCLSPDFVNGERREHFNRDCEESQGFVCAPGEQEGLTFRSHFSDRTPTPAGGSQEAEDEPRDFTVSKPLSQRVTSFSKPSFCNLPYPVIQPKACRVPPMTTHSPKQSSAESPSSFPSPNASSDPSLIVPVRPSKRSVVELDNEEVPERKVRVVTPIHPAGSVRHTDPEDLKPAEPTHAVHLPDGHSSATFTPAHLYGGMYPPGSLVSAGAQDGLQQHPGLQYLKSQSAVSPLVPPLAFHPMFLHRQLLASSSSPQHFYRHPGGAALYGDLLHHLYPLSTLPPPQLSSVHPSTRL